MPTYKPKTEIVSRLLEFTTGGNILCLNALAMSITSFFVLFPNSPVHLHSLLPVDLSFKWRLLAWFLSLLHTIHYTFAFAYAAMIFCVFSLLYFCKIICFKDFVSKFLKLILLQFQRFPWFGENFAEDFLPPGIKQVLDFVPHLKHWDMSITALNWFTDK